MSSITTINFEINCMLKKAQCQGLFVNENTLKEILRRYPFSGQRTLIYFADAYIEFKNNLFMSQLTIAKKLGVTDRTVRHCVSQLVQDNYLETKKRFNNSSLTRLVLPVVFVDISQGNIYEN